MAREQVDDAVGLVGRGEVAVSPQPMAREQEREARLTKPMNPIPEIEGTFSFVKVQAIAGWFRREDRT